MNEANLPPSRLILSQAGQGVIEYILVLIVIVSIAIGVLYQFNGSFSRWATSYFGSYFACLLETGELPGIGGAGGDTGICSQLYEKFTFTAGVPPGGGGGGGGSGGGGGGGGGGSGGGTKKPAPTPGSEGSGSSTGQASYSRAGGRGKANANSSFDQSERGAQASVKSKGNRAKAGSKNLYTGSTEISLPGSVSGQGDRSKKIKISTLDRAFGLAAGKEKDAEEKISAKTKSDKLGGGTNREEKIRVNRKVAAKEQTIDENEMSFGNFIRILIIAAIIIALVVLLGGQGLQISKSWD